MFRFAIVPAALFIAAMPQISPAQTISAQSASIAGAGGTIVASRVPVQAPSGSVNYYDVTMTLTSTEAGIAVSGTSMPSVLLRTANFAAGTYEDSSGNTYIVTGPSAGPGGATSWSLVSTAKDNANSLSGAIWYTGCGTQNPEYSRLKADKIPTTCGQYSFGVSGAQNGAFVDGGYLYAGALIGVSSTSGNGIAVTSFSTSGSDSTTATVTWPLRLVALEK